MLYAFWIYVIWYIIQAKALIAKLTEEKNAAIHQNNKLQEELVRALLFLFIILFLVGEAWVWNRPLVKYILK